METASRTRRVLQQSGIGLLARFGAVIVTFVTAPLMLQILGPQQFGVWLVLVSIFQWVSLCDLGVAAGARNEIARAAAAVDPSRVLSAITTGWWYLFLISLVLFVLAALILLLSPLSLWLERQAFGGVDVNATLWCMIAGASIALATGYIQTVFAALEKASAFSFFSLISSTIFLCLLLLEKWILFDSITEISILYVMAVVGANVWLILSFFQNHTQYRPQRHALDHSLRPKILSFGFRLFIIQLAALVIFTTSRLMASMFIGPESVVVYDAGFRIFSIIIMAHALIMSTLWSSFTHAYETNEMAWIRKSLIWLTLLMIPLTLVCIVVVFLSPWFVERWLGSELVGSKTLYGLFAIVTIMSCWSNIFSYFLNGIGNTRVQLVSAIMAGLVNIPITYFFTVTVAWGLNGILIGTIVSLSFFTFLGPAQVFYLLKARRL